MLPVLTGLARHAVRNHGQQQISNLSARAFASDAVSVQQSNPFLRFSSPVPNAIDHSPLLSTLPETKVL
jgi:processing peptidase subunit beta